MTFNWTIDVGHLLIALTGIVTLVGMYYALKADVRVLQNSVKDRFEMLGGRMINMENAMQKISHSLETLAVQKEQISQLQAKTNLQDQRIADLQHEINEARIEAGRANLS